VLTAEHLLGFTGFDLDVELVERAAEVVTNGLPGFRPFHEDVQIVELALQRLAQMHVFLEPAAALQELLRARLILPEIWRGDAFF